MDKKIKRRWLKALRSGKYQQCEGYLHLKGDGFCCLGVLCDVLKKDFKDVNWKESGKFSDNPKSKQALNFFGHNSTLPNEILLHAGLKENGRSVCVKIDKKYKDTDDYNNYYGAELTNLNDEGMSFKEIADIISKYL